jgi:hypothetical protein
MTGMDRLTDGQRRALILAVVAIMAGMAIGFLSSFLTLYGAAEVHGWRFPWRLPLSVDFGILAYVVLDHLAVTLGSRSRWLHIAAWSLAAFTIWANAAVSTTGGTVWRVIDAAMPALWVLGVEALRFTWKRVHEDQAAKADRIPAGRYLAAPLATARMRRRMWLTAETSYPRAVAIEDARLHAADLIRAAIEADASMTVPGALRRAVRTGRLPASVIAAVDGGLRFGGASEWEPEVASWITSRLTLPERLAAQLRNERQSIAAEVVPVAIEAPSPEVTPEPIQDAPQSPPRKSSGSALQRVRRMGGRKATDGDIRDVIAELSEDGSAVTSYRLVKALKGPKGGIAEPRAARVLAEVQGARPSLHVAKG